MFEKNPIDTKIEDEIITVLELMQQETDATSDKYATLTERLVTLHELRQKNRISVDTLATIVANVAGIVIVLQHERAHVIASKAFGFVRKLF